MSIKVGKQYKDAFKSICNLYKNGAVSRDVIESIDGNIIKLANSNKEFEYVETDSPNRGESFGMTSRGASWFAGFRDEEIDDSDSSWKTLIESVASNYHSKYSYVEFKEKTYEIDEQTNKENILLIVDFLNTLFTKIKPSFSSLDIEKENKNNIDDIYCASLKMAVDNGSGEAKIVLAKLFFRQENKTLVPLSADESSDMKEHISMVLGENSGEPYEIESNKIDAVVGAVENVINGEDFDQYFSVSSLEDDEIINKLIEKGPNDEVELNCRSVKVLGISHIRWSKNLYVFKHDGRPLLKFEIGIDKKLKAYCVNCGNTLLVTNNTVLMKEGYNNIVLDNNLPNLGLSIEEIESINNNSIISDHLFEVQCTKTETKRNGCSKICCAKQVVEIDGVKKCKNCPYPEILFVDEHHNYHLTKNLFFIRDAMKMVPSEDAKVCYCCHRYFSTESIKNTMCKFCNSVFRFEDNASNSTKAKNAIKLYRTYKNILPISIRVRNLFSKKYCFEEEDIIIFKLGKNEYLFNKLEIKDKGYIPAPTKINVKGR